MAEFTIKKGMNIRLAGAPALEIAEAPTGDRVEVYPTEYRGVKPRLKVKEGDAVKRGTPLFIHKKLDAFTVCSPAQGTVETIAYGPRRVIEKIVIRTSGDEAESFTQMDAAELKGAKREDILAQLLASGYLVSIRQRPFSIMADPEAKPKSIFVNAMATAPFQTDIVPALAGNENAFQAGLNLLTRLTDGSVHLVLPGDRNDLPPALTGADNVDIHRFTGPHPAGNASVHIHSLDPINPHDIVWTVRATDLIQIGRLFVDGELPRDRVIALGGPAIQESSRKHYRIRIGAPLDELLKNSLIDGETRILNGDVLAGSRVAANGCLPFACSGITAIREDRARHFLGWLVPGFKRYSQSPLFLSTWFNRAGKWDLGSNQNGGLRAMVLTGLYDKFMPMNIMVDYLVRAVLANDSDEAIKLGILETDPEDFALCAFACPSKMDLVGIMRTGLQTIEEEGI